MSIYAVILDQDSQNRLLKHFLDEFPPSGWTVKAHHVTVSVDNLPEEFKPYVNSEIPIKVVGYGKSDMAIAAQVEIEHEVIESQNTIPHITLFINEEAGAKPVMSNNIKMWQKIDSQIELNGVFKKL
jgi:hypothetical protein